MTAGSPSISNPSLLREELARRDIESAELKSLKPSRVVYQKRGALLLRVTKTEAVENTKAKLEAVQKALREQEEKGKATAGDEARGARGQ